ncbi:hypothetical protein E5D57_007214 [Metarhizium anisopliae]|nr:hypothetical protein E5D57_007214 [Metarhizium anisopliae]
MNRRVEDAIEELTVQQVLLSSLEGQTWDGVEEERNIVLRNIERLKGRIKKLRREAQAQAHTDEKTAKPSLQPKLVKLFTFYTVDRCEMPVMFHRATRRTVCTPFPDHKTQICISYTPLHFDA